MKIELLLLAMWLLMSCSKKKQIGQNLKSNLPKVISSEKLPENLSLSYQKGIIESSSLLFGLFKETDLIDITDSIPIDFNKRIRSSHIKSTDSFDLNGFEIIVDYTQTVFFDQFKLHREKPIYQSYFPIFIHNSSNQTKLFVQNENGLDVVQEAQFPKKPHHWYAISHLPIFGSNNIGIMVNPQEYLLFLVPKFQGDINTELRFRYKSGNSLIVSKPYKGAINISQFDMEHNRYLSEKIGNEGCDAVPWLFLNAQIKCDI